MAMLKVELKKEDQKAKWILGCKTYVVYFIAG